MKLGIVSDIHSNLEAFTQALSVLEQKGAEKLICLGDVVGYGANPNECLDIVRERNIPCILGNHDAAVLDLSIALSFNSNARFAIKWTSNVLTRENLHFLSQLPLLLTEEDSTFVHATPVDPESWEYLIRFADVRQIFPHFKTPLCWIGHSHEPLIFSELGSAIVLEKGKKYLINVGSVGQPRDGDPRLSCALFDTVTWKYELIRCTYDVSTASRKILNAGLPSHLAERLAWGR